MKKLQFVFLFISICIRAAMATTGVYSEKLKPDDDNLYLVISKNESTLKWLENHAYKITSNRFYSHSISMLDEGDYYSFYYYNSDGGKEFVLPFLLLKLENDSLIDTIISKYNGILTLNKENEIKGIYKLTCNATSSNQILQLVDEINTIKGVRWCEPDKLCQWSSNSDNNPLFPQQYYLKNNTNGQKDINVVPAWGIQGGSSQITVAVIDTGIEAIHEDLEDCLLEGYTVGNPYGFGTPQNANNYNNKAHGTACAGIIGACNNSLGIHGVASGVKILPVNIVPDYACYINGVRYDGFADNSQIAYAIQWASNNADILSCSWGSPSLDSVIVSAMDNARTFGRNGKGCIVVAASGNFYPDITHVSYPAAIEGVLAVGAVDRYGEITNYSQRGSSIDMVAFGGYEDIVTTDFMGTAGYSTGNYTNSFDGTSAACPQVAGVAALMLSANPSLTESQVRTKLQNTAKDLGVVGYDTIYGYGLVNAYAAVYAVAPRLVGPSAICDNATYSIANLPAGATVNWSTSPYIGIVSGQGTSTLSVVKLNDGFGDITASIILGGNVIKTLSKYDIGVGTPSLALMVYPLSPNGSFCWDFTQANNTFVVEETVNQFYDYYQLYLYKQNGNNWTQVAYCPHATSEITCLPYFGTNGWYKMVIRGRRECGYSDWWELEVLSSDSGFNNWDFTLEYQPSAENLVIRINNERESVESISAKNINDYIIQLWNESHLVKTVKTKSTECQLSVSGMKNGVYVVRVLYKGKSYSKKFIMK